VYFSIFAGVRVMGGCVLVIARTHTQTTWVLDGSRGVGQTKRSLHVDRKVYKVHLSIYILGCGF